jgi:hypothetical protein
LFSPPQTRPESKILHLPVLELEKLAEKGSPNFNSQLTNTTNTSVSSSTTSWTS